MRPLAISLASALIFSVPPTSAQTQSAPPAVATPTPASTQEPAAKPSLDADAATLTTEEYRSRFMAYLASSANNVRWWGLASRIGEIGALAKIDPRGIFLLPFQPGPGTIAHVLYLYYMPPDSPKIRNAASDVSRWEGAADAMGRTRRSLIHELAKAVSPKVCDPLFDQLHDTGISGEEAIRADFAKWESFFVAKTDPLTPRVPLDAKARAAAALESLREELRWVLFLQILSQSDRWPWNQMSWKAVTPDIEALAKDLKQELPTLELAASADPVPDDERLIAAENWDSNAYNFTKRRLRLLDDTYAKVFQKGPGAWVVKGTPELDALRKPAEADK